MPRLPSSLVRHAAHLDRHLARLLRECRDLESATNELRWLTEHARHEAASNTNRHVSADARLKHYVDRRSRGEPLQYIIGNQPFGELEILCRKNVLIPRPETEVYTTTLAKLLQALQTACPSSHADEPIKIADLCTGSGCITLLLHALLRPPASTKDPGRPLEILGVDISPHALGLARDNLRHNLGTGLLDLSCNGNISFGCADILELGRQAKSVHDANLESATSADSTTSHLMKGKWDVIVSNPPYISPTDYAPGGTVSRSVRSHEPKLALVPPALTACAGHPVVTQADQFYEAIIRIASRVDAKLVVMEIGDAQQARRVRALAADLVSSDKVLLETWRDDGSVNIYKPEEESADVVHEDEMASERAVVIWTSSWAEWRKSQKMQAK